jgi:DNA-binding LytR/AlgR family response regulator
MNTPAPLALIAEDEPLLAESLQRELRQLWPALRTEIAADGLQAVAMACKLLPDILFLDVRMPGCTGLEAAQDIADQWPPQLPDGRTGRTLPVIVFITAFDHYAVQAFEHAALDYIVKPVKLERLKQCVERIQERFLKRFEPLSGVKYTSNAPDLIAFSHSTADEQLLQGLRQLLATEPQAAQSPRLQRIQASVGSQIVFVPISEVIYFEAADKYVRVLTASRELLIRTPIKDLLPQLDSQEFWQIHRSILVRASLIETVHRDEASRLTLSLQGRNEKLAVSRLYAGLFKAM